MSKLVMLKGLPASGKSTKAKEIVEQGNWVRLNRDLLREMLHFNKWSGKNEGITIDTEKDLAHWLLSNGHNVVIDDTNLGKKHKDMWSEIARITDSKFEVVDLTDVDPFDCVMRDLLRGVKVGQDVIINMAMQYGLHSPLKGYVICDIDGTLADISHRVPILYRGETDRTKYSSFGKDKDWKGFFGAMNKDTIRQDVADNVKNLEELGYDIVFVTARPEDHKEETLQLIEKSGISWTTLIMRRSSDRRDDEIIKEEILNRYFQGGKHVYQVFDDRPSVIRMWKSHDLRVIDCGDGIEF